MRVFVTGASGFIGKAVVKELLEGGHEVLGLARSDESAETLIALGAEVHRGSLDDLESLKKGAAASEGVIHLAFSHDFSDFEGCCRKDRAAIEAMSAVLAGTDRPFINTSGTLSLASLGRLGMEDDKGDTAAFGAVRGLAETTTLSFVPQGVRASVMRLPPTNHGDGDKGFISMLIDIAREKGESMYIGDGSNRWPATHRLDTARAYRLALEKGTAGATYHAAAEEGITTKEIAEVIGEELGVPVVSKTMEEAQKLMGFISFPLSLDNPTSSKKTREVLGWQPKQPGLIEGLKTGTYFKK